MGAALAAVAACALAAVASGKTATPVLSSHAVAGVRFGTPKPQARGRGLVPTLVTSGGVSLASTLGEVRDRYGTLAIVGTDRWRSRDGLVFYVSSQVTQPAPPTSRITEIKYGTCGDW
jgi:hypothetical protein